MGSNPAQRLHGITRGCTLPRVENRPTHQLLAENLQRLAEQRAVTLAELLETASIDTNEIFAVIAGRYDADLDWLTQLAHALEVDVTQLVVDPEQHTTPNPN